MATKKDKKLAKTKTTHQAHHEEEEKKVTPQTRGLIDGSANDLHILDGSNLAGLLTQSKIDASKR